MATNKPDNGRCGTCGACKECGSRPQIVPMPYPVYPPYIPYAQPYRLYPNYAPTWQQQIYSGQQQAASSGINPLQNNAGNYQ